MSFQLLQKDNVKYIAIGSGAAIRTERDVLDILSACYEHDTSLLMLGDEALPDEFFRLGTGLAGAVLQKFANYHIKAAVVLKDERRVLGKFKELMAELNTGNDFRIYADAAEAEKWLLG